MGSHPRHSSLSRRDFLKIGSLGLAGLLLPFSNGIASAQTENLPGPLGRILEPTVPIYPTPSRSKHVVKYLWKDLVVPINQVTIGDSDPAYNRVWYRLGEDGYAHSGTVQPVRIEFNQPATWLPPEGQLGEITVPYTEARKSPAPGEPVAYRLYYATTHWITSYQNDVDNQVWYGLLDDKLKSVYYVLAKHIRLIPPEELTPLSPEVPVEQKRLEVHLDRQIMIAYEHNRPVYMARAATGARFSSGNYSTEPGRYIINRKRPSRHMAAGDRAAPNSYDLPGVPWICYFTEDGISFHGTYWHNDFGKPRSHGCINLSPAAARWVYRWTPPYVPANEQSVFETKGTIVDVI
jgi:lipoprotein-anchoring transpeptidase ErfK/SrfK